MKKYGNKSQPEPEQDEKKRFRFEFYHLYVVAIVFLVVAMLVQPYFEMRTYNKFKSADKPEATYWDAMFAELRIQDK